MLKKLFLRQQYLFLVLAIVSLLLAGASHVSAQEPEYSSSYEKVLSLTETMTDRMFAATDRMLNILNRLDSRTQKMSVEGFDTSIAKNLRADAHYAIFQALVALKKINKGIDASATSENPIGTIEEATGNVGAVIDNLNNAHQGLEAAVMSLKEPPAEGE